MPDPKETNEELSQDELKDISGGFLHEQQRPDHSFQRTGKPRVSIKNGDNNNRLKLNDGNWHE